jgi:tetraacyldisaccharide 4'-kinase
MNTTNFYFALGRPFSPVYSVAMRIREACYRRGTFKSYRLDAPVISVGNLTMGGSGKTPMVLYLSRLLQEHGFHPAVISRGYGGTAKNKVNIVSDGTRLLLEAAVAGDEPRLLAESLPGVPVLTGIVRRLPAQKALELGCDVLLLDDGFQHLSLIRDVNLVLFNADRLAGNSRVFPGGDLREPVAALHRATCFVLTGVNEANKARAEQFTVLLQKKFPLIPVAMAGYTVDVPVQFSQNGMIEKTDVDLGRAGRGFGFCGIAHPQSFHQTLEQHGISLAGLYPLDDHQVYSSAVVDRLVHKAQQTGADFLVTTEKDMVKLVGVASALALPLYGLRMQVKTDAAFQQKLIHTVCSWKKTV